MHVLFENFLFLYKLNKLQPQLLLRQQTIYIFKFQGYQGGAGGPGGPGSGPGGPMPPPSSTGPNYYPGGPQGPNSKGPNAGPPNASVPPNGPSRGPGYPYAGGPGPGPRPMYPPGNYQISKMFSILSLCDVISHIIQSGWVGQEAWQEAGQLWADQSPAVPRPPQLQLLQLLHQASNCRQLQLTFKF